MLLRLTGWSAFFVVQVNAIYDLDEQMEESSQVGSRKLAELQGSIITLHKKIAELECPRDDSLDNSIIVWYSQAFGIGSGAVSDASGTTSGESSVATICSLIEDMGMTLKRCSDPEEAISRARDLQEEGLLRCLIVGGEERGMSCGASCVKQHTEQDCLRCGQKWESHVGHECSIGGRGTWALEKAEEGEKKINVLQMMKTLTDVESPYARAHAPLPSVRTAIYTAHSTMKEEERMEFWKLGTTVTDDSKQLLAWVNAMPGWKASEEEATAAAEKEVAEKAAEAEKKAQEGSGKGFVRPPLRRQSSNNEKSLLAKYKEELEELEARKAAGADDDEAARKRLLQRVTEKHAELDESVRKRIAVLSAAATAFEELIAVCGADIAVVQADIKHYVGPHSGRDAAQAMGWLEVHGEAVVKQPGNISAEDKHLIAKHSISVHNELSFLKQMALAAKVVAHVTSPMHKKLLNLCHNWLSTFLPHCLAKVNRVSFGLLSMEDCKAALAADPHVPRSRLKLGVPFVGKDVPSKSSEFAHPDVIIGLTVLAFRYAFSSHIFQFFLPINPNMCVAHLQIHWSAQGRLHRHHRLPDGAVHAGDRTRERQGVQPAPRKVGVLSGRRYPRTQDHSRGPAMDGEPHGDPRGAVDQGGGAAEVPAEEQQRADGQAVRADPLRAAGDPPLPPAVDLSSVHALAADEDLRLGPGGGRRHVGGQAGRLLWHAQRPAASGAGPLRLRNRRRWHDAHDVSGPQRHVVRVHPGRTITS